MKQYDYLIVGAGSAGCVLADSLSADGRKQVLLVEAGPPDTSPLVHMPKGFGKLLSDPKHAWFFPTEPEPSNNHRAEYWVRGKLLGGSSSVNGMVYVRGQTKDYDDWAALGLGEWSWDAMAPYFKRMEDHSLGADDLRGVGGPLGISAGSPHYPLGDAVLAAAQALGIPVKDDLNRLEQEGIGYLSATIKHGRRQSAAQAFLKPARQRPNLTVLTDTVVHRVLFEGHRACGVVGVRDEAAAEYRSGQVILSAGALASPKLLQLSGIGPGSVLQSMGIATLVDRPEVGQNMREHRLLFIQHRLKRGGSLNKAFSGVPLVMNTLRYLLTRTGVMAGGSYDIGGFARSRPGLDRPDVQLMMAPYSMNFAAQSYEFEKFPGMQVFGYVLRPTSRGSVSIRSPNPDDPPSIRPNYLATDADRSASIDMVKLLRRWMAQLPLAEYVGEETTPGAEVTSNEAVVDAFARLGQSGYHACGTCRMGTDDAAVLDSRLRVRGVENLRVVDLSMFPQMISGNTNGPMMALAGRAADLIREDAQ